MKYDRLPDLCAVCVHLAHVFKEHGSGVHPPSALIFKDMRASWSVRTNGHPARGWGDCSGRSARMQGRGGGFRSDDGYYDADMDLRDIEKSNKQSSSHGQSTF